MSDKVRAISASKLHEYHVTVVKLEVEEVGENYVVLNVIIPGVQSVALKEGESLELQLVQPVKTNRLDIG